MGKPHKQNLLWIICIVLAFGICFSKKPFHIDDVYFLEIAENILKHPTDPFHGAVTLVDYDFAIFQRSAKAPNTFDTMSHPPLVSYVLAGIMRLTGSAQERPLHLTFVLFTLLCSISMYFLAARFTSYPFIATILLISSPLFLVNSTNLMTDIPMLAFGFSALVCFILGMDQSRIATLFLSGILTAFAILTRYVAIGLIPLYLCYTLLHRKDITKLFWVLCPVLLIFGLWTFENWMHHGGIHLIASGRHYSRFYGDLSFNFDVFLQKMISNLSGTGGTFFFILMFLLIRASNKGRSIFLYVGAFALMVILLVNRPFYLEILNEYSNYQLALLLLFATTGLFLIVAAFENGKTFQAESHVLPAADRLFLKVWLAGAITTSILLLPFGTGRYMLPALPPLVFLLASRVRFTSTEVRFNKIVGNIMIILTFLLSILLAIADYEHAISYKKFAKDLKARFSGNTIWFVGEWSFRYYMNQEGYRYLLSTNNSPQAGDLIVKASTAGFHDFFPSLSRRSSIVKTVSVSSSLPVRLMNSQSRAGFYSHGFGFLPFAFSGLPIETFSIYEVRDLPD